MLVYTINYARDLKLDQNLDRSGYKSKTRDSHHCRIRSFALMFWLEEKTLIFHSSILPQNDIKSIIETHKYFIQAPTVHQDYEIRSLKLNFQLTVDRNGKMELVLKLVSENRAYVRERPLSILSAIMLYVVMCSTSSKIGRRHWDVHGKIVESRSRRTMFISKLWKQRMAMN